MADHLKRLISSLPPEDQAEVVQHMTTPDEVDRLLIEDRSEAEAEYRAMLPARMAKIADDLSALLPEGLSFEWGPDA